MRSSRASEMRKVVISEFSVKYNLNEWVTRCVGCKNQVTEMLIGFHEYWVRSPCFRQRLLKDKIRSRYPGKENTQKLTCKSLHERGKIVYCCTVHLLWLVLKIP